MLRYLLALLGCLTLQAAAAQSLCGPPTIKQLFDEGSYAVADAQGTVLIPYARRPLEVLTPALVKVALQFGQAKWGVLDLHNQLRLPIEYDEHDLEDAGCGYVCARLPGQTSLYDPAGKLVYRRGGRATLYAYPRWNVLVELSRSPNQPRDAQRDTMRLLDLRTRRELSRQTPARYVQPVYVDLAARHPGRRGRALPFFAVAQERDADSGRDLVRVLDQQGRVRFDSLANIPSADEDGAVLLYRNHRPLLVADTLLQLIPWLSNRYDAVQRGGPNLRDWTVSRQGLSGVLDGHGREVLPMQYAGQLEYTGGGCWLLIGRRQHQTAYSLLLPDHRLLDLGDYYLQRGIDATLTAQPLLLQHQKTGKFGLLDPARGSWLLPARYDRLEQVGDGVAFFQGDSTGYLDGRGHRRLLTPNCQELSAYFEGLAVCGKLVPNASRQQYPSAQIRYGTDRAPVALQYAYMNEQGKLVTGYFDWVGAFRDGYAQVIKNNESYMINRQGQRAELPGGLQLASYFGPSGLAVVRQGQRYGLADPTGRLVLPASYQRIATDKEYPQPNNLASRDNSRHHLEPFLVPKLTKGAATVTTDDGKQAQVPVGR